MSGYVEGWAHYAENPILSDDVRLFDESILQKLGMYKMQIWRAVRLIVDTGLHYRNESKSWAVDQFKKYMWDSSDVIEKEVIRYMSAPGQATSYSVGRSVFLRSRLQAAEQLGILFDLKDFHYQVLSLGQVSLRYLEKYMYRYIGCTISPNNKFCEYIQTPVKSISKDSRESRGHTDVINSHRMRYM